LTIGRRTFPSANLTPPSTISRETCIREGIIFEPGRENGVDTTEYVEGKKNEDTIVVDVPKSIPTTTSESCFIEDIDREQITSVGANLRKALLVLASNGMYLIVYGRI